jgi:hypothetical protein
MNDSLIHKTLGETSDYLVIFSKMFLFIEEPYIKIEQIAIGQIANYIRKTVNDTDLFPSSLVLTSNDR